MFKPARRVWHPGSVPASWKWAVRGLRLAIPVWGGSGTPAHVVGAGVAEVTTSAAPPGFTATDIGFGFEWDDQSGGKIAFPHGWTPGGSTEITVLSIGRLKSEGSDSYAHWFRWGHPDSVSSTPVASLAHHDTTDTMYFELSVSGTKDTSGRAQPGLSTDTWYCVVGRWRSGSGRQISVFTLDGGILDESTGSAVSGTIDAPLGHIQLNAYDTGANDGHADVIHSLWATWDRYLTDAEIRALLRDPFGMFRIDDGPEVWAAGSDVVSGSGSSVASSSTSSGSGTVTVSGSGGSTASSATSSGTGQATVSGSGSSTASSSTSTGSGTAVASGSGSSTASSSTSSGSGQTVTSGSGSSTASSSTSTGSGTVTASGSGSSTASSSVSSGSGQVIVSGSGSSTASSSVSSGTGKTTDKVTGSGSSTASSSTSSGTGTVTVSGSGTSVASSSTSSGTGTVVGAVTGSGSSTASSSTSSGTGTVTVSGSGGSTITAATSDGQGTVVITGSGASIVSSSTSSGTGRVGETVTPAERTLTVEAEDRTLAVDAETRTLTVPSEDRTLVVEA